MDFGNWRDSIDSLEGIIKGQSPPPEPKEPSPISKEAEENFFEKIGDFLNPK